MDWQINSNHQFTRPITACVGVAGGCSDLAPPYVTRLRARLLATTSVEVDSLNIAPGLQTLSTKAPIKEFVSNGPTS
jgi:hypothetical protein